MKRRIFFLLVPGMLARR